MSSASQQLSVIEICITVNLLGAVKVKKWILLVTTILLLCSSVARADSLEEVVEAYNKGNYAQVLELLHPLAAMGIADAQYRLGFIYHMGKGVDQDYQKAAKWYYLAAEQGHAVAQNNLGWMFDVGKGVAQDYQEAVKWYRLAAEQGDAVAQNNLGWLYDEGKGVVQDYQEAAKWYRLAAEQGHAVAQNNLGAMHVKLGVEI